MIELMLPYPPSVNHYKEVGRLVRTKNGKIFQQRRNSTQTLQYYCDVMNLCLKEGVKSFDSATISVEAYVYPPDKRKRDLDGILKVLLDSLQHARVYKDDHQICRLLVQRCGIIPNGQIFVRITLP